MKEEEWAKSKAALEQEILDLRPHVISLQECPSKEPWKNLQEEDTIRELPNEKRSFESNLANLEEEDTYWTKTKIEIDADAELAKYEESVADGTYTPPFSDTEQIQDSLNDEFLAELQDCGLTDEEIADYQNLPAD